MCKCVYDCTVSQPEPQITDAPLARPTSSFSSCHPGNTSAPHLLPPSSTPHLPLLLLFTSICLHFFLPFFFPLHKLRESVYIYFPPSRKSLPAEPTGEKKIVNLCIFMCSDKKRPIRVVCIYMYTHTQIHTVPTVHPCSDKDSQSQLGEVRGVVINNTGPGISSTALKNHTEQQSIKILDE